MREFLLGLYLEHGEREFEFRYWDLHNAGLSQMMGEYIANTTKSASIFIETNPQRTCPNKK